MCTWPGAGQCQRRAAGSPPTTAARRPAPAPPCRHWWEAWPCRWGTCAAWTARRAGTPRERRVNTVVVPPVSTPPAPPCTRRTRCGGLGRWRGPTAHPRSEGRTKRHTRPSRPEHHYYLRRQSRSP
eukprot:scaffold21393_cov122-Isochrysis_galbana.AAC.3